MSRSVFALIVFFTAFNAAVSVAVMRGNQGVEDYRIAPSDDGMQGERNERSTPRSFVLHATPAVTEIAEERDGRTPEAVVIGCLVTLARLERRVYLSESANSAANRAAIFEFQRASGLPTNGSLDSATRATLACE